MASAGANERHSENEHDEAVKMVIFSRARKAAKCDLSVPGESHASHQLYGPLRLAAHMACAGASQRHSENEHDQAVKMVIFSRAKKAAKCDLNTNTRQNRCFRLVAPQE